MDQLREDLLNSFALAEEAKYVTCWNAALLCFYGACPAILCMYEVSPASRCLSRLSVCPLLV